MLRAFEVPINLTCGQDNAFTNFSMLHPEGINWFYCDSTIVAYISYWLSRLDHEDLHKWILINVTRFVTLFRFARKFRRWKLDNNYDFSVWACIMSHNTADSRFDTSLTSRFFRLKVWTSNKIRIKNENWNDLYGNEETLSDRASQHCDMHERVSWLWHLVRGLGHC